MPDSTRLPQPAEEEGCGRREAYEHIHSHRYSSCLEGKPHLPSFLDYRSILSTRWRFLLQATLLLHVPATDTICASSIPSLC